MGDTGHQVAEKRASAPWQTEVSGGVGASGTGPLMVYFDFEPGERYRSTWAPVLDVYEGPEEFVIRVELPGVRKESVNLTWKNEILTISGVKERQPKDHSQLRYICVERQYGRFRRDVAIRAGVDFTRATAEFTEGLLHIHLPRREEGTAESTIPIT